MCGLALFLVECYLLVIVNLLRFVRFIHSLHSLLPTALIIFTNFQLRAICFNSLSETQRPHNMGW